MDKAARFRWARKRLGITQEDLADRVGCAQSMVAKIERGGAERTKLVMDFARELRVRPEWLDTGEGSPDASIKDKPVKYEFGEKPDLAEMVMEAAELSDHARPALTKAERKLLIDLEDALRRHLIDTAGIKVLASMLRVLSKPARKR